MSHKLPMIFTGENIRAILEGRKTQTRRVIKPQPELRDVKEDCRKGAQNCHICDDLSCCDNLVIRHALQRSRYKVGMILWVRETWKYDDWNEEGMPWIRYRADNTLQFIEGCNIPEEYADRLTDIWATLSVDFARKGRACDERWRPSIHMPRWASRITLTVTEVWRERVQEITDEDARAEGVTWVPAHCCRSIDCGASYIERFSCLWDSINGKRPGCSWADNPWVRVISFARKGPV